MSPKELSEQFARCREELTKTHLLLDETGHPEASELWELCLAVSDKMNLIEQTLWKDNDRA